MKKFSGVVLLLRLVTSVFAEPRTANVDVDVILEKIRSENALPAVGGLVIVDGEVKGIGAVGLRKFKGKESVTVDDKWHIGSCTKSMTATLAATFIEEGSLKWDSTIGEVFGLKVRMRDEYKNVTLKTLLNNRSGIPGSAPLPVLIKARMNTGKRDIAKRRQQFVEELLGMKPDFEPGSQYAYSNSGFVVAGAMLEAVSGKSWEELMQERLFKPLKMESAGFGGAASKGKEDQPWGHHSKTKPQAPGRDDDNPDVIGPAGTVHCSLADLGRYVRMHACHEVGPVLKKAETFARLQEIGEGNEDYACGWVVYKRPWAKGPALMHNGSNTMNYCLIWMAPKRKFAVIAVSNVDIQSATAPCNEVVTELMKTFLVEGAAGLEKGAKVSPFGGVRWKADEAMVKVGAEWFKLVSLDGLASEDIVKFCQAEHADKWKRRFAEDLVEVLEEMGHPPKTKVQLVVQAADSSTVQTLDNVVMTKENRDAIRSARVEADQ